MDALFTIEGVISLLTLTLLEIVLGIDNIIFISLVTQDLESSKQPMARRLGLGLALLFRVLMLLGITWLIGLTAPIFSLMDHPIAGRDLILFLGGVFLLFKASSEIFKKRKVKVMSREIRQQQCSRRLYKLDFWTLSLASTVYSLR